VYIEAKILVGLLVQSWQYCKGCSLFQVVEQNGQWYCEYDGKTYPSMVRRYVTTIRCTDNTAELTLNAFNEQVTFSLCYGGAA